MTLRGLPAALLVFSTAHLANATNLANVSAEAQHAATTGAAAALQAQQAAPTDTAVAAAAQAAVNDAKNVAAAAAASNGLTAPSVMQQANQAKTTAEDAQKATGADPIPGSATDPAGRKSKTLLVLFQIFGLGCCSVDRFFLNGCSACGVIKLVTCGGCIIWALIDTIIIVANALGKEEGIDNLGMKAWFEPQTVDPAYYLGYVWIGLTGLSVLSSCLGALHHKE